MNTQTHDIVKEHYGPKLKDASSCCGNEDFDQHALKLGYTGDKLQESPADANLGLGCGNPLAMADIRPGDTVLDLGSGAGFDCFIASYEVGPKGKVIGVDMTPEMIERAEKNRLKSGINNVEFRLGKIEDLPVSAESVDLIISNCVINLSPEKEAVFKEAFRVLKPGGTLQLSDIVLRRKLPRIIQNNVAVYLNCVAGASLKDAYLESIRNAGFTKIDILESRSVSEIFPENVPTIEKMIRLIPLPIKIIRKLSGLYAESIKIRAHKSQ